MITRLFVFLILFIGITICSHAQTSNQLVEVSKIYIKKDIILTDGMVYKWTVVSGNDTARYFNPGADKYEAVVTFKKVGGTTPLPDLITNIDNVSTVTANTYAPAWIQFTNAAFFNSTASYSPTTGAKLTTKFTGYKIEWWTERARNHGIALVKIDNDVTFNIDLYANTTANSSQKVFEWTGSEGPHTIEISVTGTKNIAATESNVIHDRFLVYTKQ